MNTQDENNEDVTQTSAYNAFPEPQTIPAGWDTSGFFAAPQPAPVVQADGSLENEAE